MAKKHNHACYFKIEHRQNLIGLLGSFEITPGAGQAAKRGETQDYDEIGEAVLASSQYHERAKMTWHAILHRHGTEVLCDPLGAPTRQGTLLLETRLTDAGTPMTILAMPLSGPDVGTLTLKTVPGGGIVLVIARRSGVYHAAVKMRAEERLDALRILYSWDMDARIGRLAVERTGRQSAQWTTTAEAVPVAPADLVRFGDRHDLAAIHPDLRFAAISEQVEPLGPSPGLSALTPTPTQRGLRNLMQLRRADHLVSDYMRKPQMVLSTVDRIVPAFGSFAPVRLRAPYFGLTQDTIVSPDQRMLIGGSSVEYTFGCELVLVAARHLVNGLAARWEDAGPLVRYAQCVLPQHAPIQCNGALFESLYVGRIRRHNGAFKASILKDIDPIFIPEQARAPYRVLSAFEAMALIAQRAA